MGDSLPGGTVATNNLIFSPGKFKNHSDLLLLLPEAEKKISFLILTAFQLISILFWIIFLVDFYSYSTGVQFGWELREE